MKHPEAALRAYRDLLVAEPVSVTSVRDPGARLGAPRADALTALELVRAAGAAHASSMSARAAAAPGIPIAIAAGIDVTLLEASAAKCDFLRRSTAGAGPAVPDRPRALRAVRPRSWAGGLRPGPGPCPGAPCGGGRAVPAARPAWAATCSCGRPIPMSSRSAASRRRSAARWPRSVAVRPQPASAAAGEDALPRRSGFRAGREWPPSVRSDRYDLAHERPRLRPCKPEGRRRQDDHRHQHGRMRRRGGHARAAHRPRSAGECHHRPRIPARAARAPAPTTCCTAGRSTRSWSRPASRTSGWCPRIRIWPPRRSSCPRSPSTERCCATSWPAPRSGSPTCSSTARHRSACSTVNALAAANRLIVPVQCEYYALEGLAQLLQSIELVRTRINPRLGITGVLLTMYDARTRLASDVAERGAHPLRPAGVRHGRSAQHPPGRGPQPRRCRSPRYDASSAGADAYYRAALEVVERG